MRVGIKVTKNSSNKRTKVKHELLGSGIHGDVYAISNKEVLKITSSKQEAEVSKLFISKKLPHVVKIFEVKKIQGEKLWAIRMERLYQHNLVYAQGHIHVLKGMVSFARMGYYHWDLKNDNIMYDRKTKSYKIIDLASLSKARGKSYGV
jgi:serine/threonine protein kinase